MQCGKTLLKGRGLYAACRERGKEGDQGCVKFKAKCAFVYFALEFVPKRCTKLSRVARVTFNFFRI